MIGSLLLSSVPIERCNYWIAKKRLLAEFQTLPPCIGFVILAKCLSIFLICRVLKPAIRCAFVVAISLQIVVQAQTSFSSVTLCECKPPKLPPCREAGTAQVENSVPAHNKLFSSKCLFLKHSLTSLPGKTVSCAETQEEELGSSFQRSENTFAAPTLLMKMHLLCHCQGGCTKKLC